MSEKNSIQLILSLESKIQALIKAYKTLKKDYEVLEKEMKTLKQNNAQLRSEKIQLEEKLKHSSAQLLLQGNTEELENLRKYLDEVIEQLNKNIELL